jgi:hypothetical protein
VTAKVLPRWQGVVGIARAHVENYHVALRPLLHRVPRALAEHQVLRDLAEERLELRAEEALVQLEPLAVALAIVLQVSVGDGAMI